LLHHLPRNSAVHREIDPDRWMWTESEELLALVAELVSEGNRLYIMAHAKRGARTPEPLHIPRPGERSERRKPSSPSEVRGFFGAREAPGRVKVE
jgi:hypothetical protein